MKLDGSLTKDCPPQYLIPQSGPVTLEAVTDRLVAVESALAFCRNQLALIEASQK